MDGLLCVVMPRRLRAESEETCDDNVPLIKSVRDVIHPAVCGFTVSLRCLNVQLRNLCDLAVLVDTSYLSA